MSRYTHHCSVCERELDSSDDTPTCPVHPFRGAYMKRSDAPPKPAHWCQAHPDCVSATPDVPHECPLTGRVSRLQRRTCLYDENVGVTLEEGPVNLVVLKHDGASKAAWAENAATAVLRGLLRWKLENGGVDSGDSRYQLRQLVEQVIEKWHSDGSPWNVRAR